MTRARGRPKINEAAFMAQVLAYARRSGWFVHHSRPAVDRRGRWATPIAGDAGLPDLVMARGGRVVFLELKGDGGRLDPPQVAWAQALLNEPPTFRPARGRAYHEGPFAYMVAWPDDWDEVEALLRRPRGAW